MATDPYAKYLDGLQKLRVAQMKDAEKDDAAADARRRAELAADTEIEKTKLTRPKTVILGTTAQNPKPILVWHHAAEPPRALAFPQSRPGSGPLLALLHGGGLANIAKSLRAKRPNVFDAYPEYVEKLRAVLVDVGERYGDLLRELRDDKAMAALFRAAEIAKVEKETRTVAGQLGVYQQPVTKITVPELISVTITPEGINLTFKGRAGDSAKRWASKIDLLQAAFARCGVPTNRLKVVGRDGDIVVRFNDADPLSQPLPQVIHPYDEARGRSYLGKAEDGSDVFLTWKNNASSLIAGMQGSGKTASLMPLFAGLAGRVELHIVDCGASGEWEIFSPVCASYDDSGDLDAVARVMDYAMAASVKRMAIIKKFGAINFWELSIEQRRAAGLHHVVILLEEAPTALGQGQSDKADKQQAEINMGVTGRTVKTVRKAGFTVVIVAQKPAATEIPTIIRDNAGQRVCFRLDSLAAATTVLGDSAALEPRVTDIPAGKAGRFVARVDGRGNLLGQAVYVPVEKLKAHLADAQRIPPMDETTVADDEPVVDEAADSTSEEALLAALAEAQRRGLIKPPPATDEGDI